MPYPVASCRPNARPAGPSIHTDTYTTAQTLDTSAWVGTAVLKATGGGGTAGDFGGDATGGGGGGDAEKTLAAPFDNPLELTFAAGDATVSKHGLFGLQTVAVQFEKTRPGGGGQGA